MKKLLILLIISILFSGCVTQISTPPISPTKETGHLMIAFKDSIQRLRGLGKATQLDLEISTISVVKDDSEINILDNTKKFDLLQFSDKKALLVEKEFETGNYDGIKIYIENASVRIYNLEMYIFNKTYLMWIPDKEINLNYSFIIEKNKKLILILDFDVPYSITKEPDPETGIYYYTLRPVIEISEETLEFDQTCGDCEVV
ncbi:MAG: DUF4382 domain-containing protein [Candidatus Aenigmatarchaeota archaeon]